MAITESTNPPGILVAGCGKLGGAIASRLKHSATVFGLRRNPDRVPEGVQGIGADLTRPATLAGQLPDNLDIVIYCLTPSSYDESSAVNPVRFSGGQILAGEQTALGSNHPATIIRFSGIYGPSRARFLEEVRQGRMNPQPPAPFSNRIHEEDAAEAAAHLVRLALSGAQLEPCYIASDCEPVRLDEVVDWVRQQTPCADPVPDARQGGRAGSKRCKNQRLLATGFQFRYPDFRAGYSAMISKH